MEKKTYNEQAVVQAIAQALDSFYESLISKIDTLNISKVMKRKNPYLYRAKAMQSASFDHLSKVDKFSKTISSKLLIP